MQEPGSNYFMSSTRIGFRFWQENDLPLAHKLWGNSRVTKYFNKVPLSLEQIRERLLGEMETAERIHVQYWPIFLLRDNEHIGCAGLRSYKEKTLELGFHLKPEYWGCGLATEAARAVIEYTFGNNLAEALFAGHHPDNIASQRTLVKLGFLGSACLFYEATGEMHPSYFLYKKDQRFSTRPATASDAQALALVHSASIYATFKGILDDYVAERSLDYCLRAWKERLAQEGKSQTIVLMHGEQIAGFVTSAASKDANLRERTGAIDRIYVHPQFWRKGLGQQLISCGEKLLVERGYKTISLWVFEANENARRFYERNSYKPDGVKKEAYNARLLRYIKQLQS